MALNEQIQYKDSGRHFMSERMMLKENNDCVVRAIAIALGLSYEKSRRLCAKYLQREAGRGVYRHCMLEGLQALAWECGYMVERRFKDGWGRIAKNSEYFVENRRHTGRFPILRYALRNPKGRHMLLVKGHAVAMVDQVVHDNRDRTSGRHNVEEAFTFTPIQDL